MRRWTIGSPSFEADAVIPMLNVAPWAGHREFAYDLVRFVRPKVVVELGTHYGCSFFSFCQAVKDSRLNSSVIAVDTWQGDQHAGFYGEEVFDAVTAVVEGSFGSVNIDLKRMQFAEAAQQFRGDSVDLLHIDGLHTYEAVSSDFAEWLPKLRRNGIIMLHDINPDLDYGSRRFWGEVRQTYPVLEFTHSWGLGVVFPKGRLWLRRLLANNIQDKMLYYREAAENRRAGIELSDAQRMLEERYRAIREMDQMIRERDKVIEAQASMLEAQQRATAEARSVGHQGGGQPE